MEFLYNEELIYFLLRIFTIVFTVFMIKMVIRILYYDGLYGGITFNRDKDSDKHENKVDLKKKNNDDIGIYLN